jgi:phosphoglycolate phosphatase
VNNNKASYLAVLFDFDYTLADSSEGIIECVNLALRTLDLPQAGAAEIRAAIGLSLTGMFSRLAGPGYAELAPEFLRLFVQHADQVMANHTRVYPGVPNMLCALQACRLRLGILSTKFRYRIEAVLQREGLRAPFDLIVGSEDVSQHKPDPEGLLLALDRLGCQPTQLLYVGDSVTDAETAQSAGVPFVAVLSGVTPRQLFGGYPTQTILEDISHLPQWLRC